jgi:hypothetical protein
MRLTYEETAAIGDIVTFGIWKEEFFCFTAPCHAVFSRLDQAHATAR